jgi:hypothetical protein
MQRRPFLLAPLLLGGLPARGEEDGVIAALRAGGVALLLRHAVTEPGLGDPPGMRLEDCASQRNLSADGRAQSQRIGAWFSQRRLEPAAVRSSGWCRCLDTARLAFGRAERWPPLDSFFDDRSREPAQTAALRAALSRIAPGRFEVWVTHQVNITALTGQGPAMGEGFVAAAPGGRLRLVGRLAVG